MASNLYVVRHGATEWSKNGRHTGLTDIPLVTEGEEQARTTGLILQREHFALVLTSPLQRARRTCELAGLGDQAEVDHDLLELDYGDYEGITTSEIRETIPDWSIWSGDCPNEETLSDVAVRVDRVIERARAVDGNVAVFAHGHVLRVLTARWCDLAPVEGRRFVLDPATLSILGWERENAAILQWNLR
ncbi:phoE Broad specificity phosphatase PhoE and related phosphatases [Acidimicrobiia bacterium]